MDDLINLLCEAPDSQIDSSIRKKLAELKGRESSEVKEELKSIADECARWSLASDFAMRVFDAMLSIEDTNDH